MILLIMKLLIQLLILPRDLHCWEASLNLRPFGQYKSYMFRINVKAAMLQDLQLKKQRSQYDNY